MSMCVADLPGTGWEPMEPGADDWWVHEPSGVRVAVDARVAEIYGPTRRAVVERFALPAQRARFLATVQRRIQNPGRGPVLRQLAAAAVLTAIGAAGFALARRVR